uniref:Uncharacterized protein n=1 Tax=Glossina palpalis gambiensis TaxID=67801 RepID=A0A1B0ANM2_9MUSC
LNKQAQSTDRDRDIRQLQGRIIESKNRTDESDTQQLRPQLSRELLTNTTIVQKKKEKKYLQQTTTTYNFKMNKFVAEWANECVKLEMG